MVSIKSIHTVIPTEATPNATLLLSESEQIKSHTHALTIYIYRTNHDHNHHNIIDTIKHSLGNILILYYPLAGRLRMIQGGRMEIDCNGKGVMLFEAESRKTLQDYGDFMPTTALRPLLPTVDYREPVENIPLVLVQVTRFACGGLCVGFGVSNVVVDGISGTVFVDAWAKLARGGTLGEDEKPILDKMVILKSEFTAPRFEHREFKPLPLIIGSSDASEESKKETDLAILKLTREMAEKLKKKANDDGCLEFGYEEAVTPQKHHRPYSRYESIAAHIWRCACKARYVDHNQPTVVLTVAGVRNRLKPPLPLNYFGNATHPTVSPTCHSGDIASKPLRYGAQKIREAIELLTDEYLRSAFEFIGSQDDVGWLRPKLNSEPPFLGNPNLNIWSWMSNMPTYGPDFGWGRPLYMGPCEVVGDGRAFIMPAPTGDGTLSVVIRLQTPHLQPFEKFFYEDI
ncbi:hydroxycinnamoyl-CoA:piscidic acid hydroxycinnamoyltransferase-like [Arachis stenosperma]|uniref:hydroxycinnamoyl-CoA:piscidic acid hydroxycinnamoyltransferase-like n=1 Tax=Arachis stenosperma TaxID=217475 RepID=UPI0025AB6103|nr:hydroxycinnamoyl-CoA:piscidic acid hydroxycinnamoyltransferase-like [Arachis stenosperma]